jgi:hypothetical protein
LGIRPHNDGFHVFYLILRDVIETESPLAPMEDLTRFGLDVSSANDLRPAFGFHFDDSGELVSD